MGDDHFWGVWHRFAPYTAYRRIRPFRSEAGINAMPVLDSWLAFTPQEKRWPLTREWIEYRGSYQTRFSHLPKQDRYAGEYGPSRSLGEYIRKSQLAQALGDAFNIEFCRSRKFQNSGVLIWQFNDAYPCASWSMVDWYGTPKSSYYAIKRANRPLHVAADFETYLWKPGQTFVAEISLLNDLEEAFRNMRVESSLWDVQGALLDRKKVEGGVGANRSRTVLTHQWQIPKTMDGRMFFLSVRLINPKCQLVSDLIYPMAVRDVEALPFTDEQARDRNFNRFSHYANIFEEIAELPLLKPDILCRWESGKGLQVRITNKGRSLLFQARLRLMHEGSPIQAFYQDNDVTLLPGETRLIEVRGLKGGLVPQGSELVLEDWNALDRKVIPLDTSGGPHGSAQRGR